MPCNEPSDRRRLPLPNAWEVRELFIQFTLLPFAFLPRFAALAACRLWAQFLMRRGGSYHLEMAALLPTTIRDRLGASTTHALRISEAFMLYDRILALRNVLFPWWKRPVRVQGLEHVRGALQVGNGAILWNQSCLGTALAVKQGLYGAGYPLVHLSRPAHGFSPYPFGMRVLNPTLNRAESRLLAERVVIADGSLVGPLRRLYRRLSENRVISISVTAAASDLVPVPFLGGTLNVPTGPIHLARMSRAALLPVFTVGSTHRATVIVGPPLAAVGSEQRKTRECVDGLCKWLESQIAAHPADWIGWRVNLLFSAAPESGSAATPSPGSP